MAEKTKTACKFCLPFAWGVLVGTLIMITPAVGVVLAISAGVYVYSTMKKG